MGSSLVQQCFKSLQQFILSIRLFFSINQNLNQRRKLNKSLIFRIQFLFDRLQLRLSWTMPQSSHVQWKLICLDKTIVFLIKNRKQLLISDKLFFLQVLNAVFHHQNQQKLILFYGCIKRNSQKLIIESYFIIDIFYCIKYKMAQKKKLWVMSESQYQTFERYRQSTYKQICINNQFEKGNFPDHKLMKYYVSNMVCFLRARKNPKDRPFKFEKVIYSAVTFFKRYYLINSFIDQEPMQNCICAMYIALKLNQYTPQYIQKMAEKWRTKEWLQPKRNHYHFGVQGYTEKEAKFLQGIGYQTGRSKMIDTIQSLYIQIQQKQIKKLPQILEEIRRVLQKVYTNSSLFFTQDGCKISLAIVLSSLDKILDKYDMKQIFGGDLFVLIQTNKSQISRIIQRILKLQDQEIKNAKSQQILFLRKITKVHYKKPQYKKSPKFIGRHDSMIFD